MRGSAGIDVISVTTLSRFSSNPEEKIAIRSTYSGK